MTVTIFFQAFKYGAIALLLVLVATAWSTNTGGIFGDNENEYVDDDEEEEDLEREEEDAARAGDSPQAAERTRQSTSS